MPNSMSITLPFFQMNFNFDFLVGTKVLLLLAEWYFLLTKYKGVLCFGKTPCKQKTV